MLLPIQVENVPGSRLCGAAFTKFWINYSQGTITVGVGEPGQDSSHYSYTDPDPIASLKHIGLSAWDKHVAYRNVELRPAVSLKAAQQQPASAAGGHADSGRIPSLKQLCRDSLEQHLDIRNVCSALHTVEALEPALDDLNPPLMRLLAKDVEQVVADDLAGFCQLPGSCLESLFQESDMVRCLLALTLGFF